MIETALCLLGFQLAGEVLARGLGLPLPGPVLGMLLLFVALSVRRGVPVTLQIQVPRFLAHMSLLFIPAGGAVLAYQGLLAEHGARLAAVLALSTLTTLLVPGLALHWMLARRRRRSGHGGH
ncbi:murein hydrolase transporter LrgA [Chromobacterium sp. LK1]|uniref:CidA/LrgA family protein n=1 Tax=Chromobacterium sp. LK1 TaxID=1628193 RepID=UPI0006531CAB|nr:CidA/LrgA family protein [Chromobacterium sp. LK1]KMN36334.1 murein hydrolase transporter LrgA [Chromobacterium sp. LK1]